MARYFFDFSKNGDLIKDKEGVDLNGLEEMRAEAIATLPDLAKRLDFDVDHHIFNVTVRDAMGNPVFRAELLFNCAWLE